MPYGIRYLSLANYNVLKTDIKLFCLDVKQLFYSYLRTNSKHFIMYNFQCALFLIQAI